MRQEEVLALKEIINLELEIAGKLEYLVNCQESGNSDVRNVSRELALKVMVNWDKERLAELMNEEMNKVKKFISS